MLAAQIGDALALERLLVAQYGRALHDVVAHCVPPLGHVRVLLSGFHDDVGASVWEIDGKADPVEHHRGAFGVSWAGQRQIVDRLLLGLDAELRDDDGGNGQGTPTPLPLATMSLDDAFEFVPFLIRTTANFWRLCGTYAFAGAGGHVDVVRTSETTRAQRKRFGDVDPMFATRVWYPHPAGSCRPRSSRRVTCGRRRR